MLYGAGGARVAVALEAHCAALLPQEVGDRLHTIRFQVSHTEVL
jgi:hypothetical protein